MSVSNWQLFALFRLLCTFCLPLLQANVPVLQSTCPAPVQLHVLSYSLHALLCDLSKHLASGDLDSCLQSITDIGTEDLFGQLAEEREVPEAVSKLPEAKSSKGLATLEIVSSKLSPQLLPSLIAPLKKVGAVHHNFSWARVPMHTARCLTRHFTSCNTFCVAPLPSLCTFPLYCIPCVCVLPSLLAPFHVSRLLKVAPVLSCLVKLRRHCPVCRLVSRTMRGSAPNTCSCSFIVWCLTVSPSSPAVKGGEEWREGRVGEERCTAYQR